MSWSGSRPLVCFGKHDLPTFSNNLANQKKKLDEVPVIREIPRDSLFDLRSGANEFMRPKVEIRVPQQFDESDQKPPWVRAVDNQTLQQNTANKSYNSLASVIQN